MSPLPQARLQAAVRSSPTPILGLDEDDRWIHIGAVRLSKVGARVDIGYTHGVNEKTRFELQEFDVDGRMGAAIILCNAGILPDYYIGWVPAAAMESATAWVARLNAEIGALLSRTKREVEAGRSAHTLIFHMGAEYAPDAPWGGEAIELRVTGELHYEQRRSGSLVRAVHGRVEPQRVRDLLALLAHTSFPKRLQEFFPPGASVCKLITDPPYREMAIDDSAGDPNYEQILGSLMKLAKALRESDEAELHRWDWAHES